MFRLRPRERDDSLRDAGARFATADHEEAFTVQQWIDQAREAGVPDGDIGEALGRDDWAAVLHQRIEERTRGTERATEAVDSSGNDRVAEEGQDSQYPEDQAGARGPAGGDLFPAASNAERLRAAREAKDAERNGLNRPQQPFTNTDLGATPHGQAPEQARIPDKAENPNRVVATAPDGGAWTFEVVPRGDVFAVQQTSRHGSIVTPTITLGRYGSRAEAQGVARDAAERRTRGLLPTQRGYTTQTWLDSRDRTRKAPEPVHEVSEHDLSPEDQELVRQTRERAARAQDNRTAESALEEESRQRGEREAGELGLRGAVVEALGADRMDNVHFVHDEDGLPADVRGRGREVKRGNVRYGLHTPDGHSYIFTKAANTPGKAAWTAIHEKGGHDGFQRLVQAFKDVRLGTRTVAEAYESARKLVLQNPTVAKLAAVIEHQRRPENWPEMTPAQKAAFRYKMAEEAMAELQAALRTGDWGELVSKYGAKARNGIKEWNSEADIPKHIRQGVQGAIANFARRMKAILNAIHAKITGEAHSDAFTDADVRDMLDAMWEAARGGEAGRGEMMDSQSPIKSVDANIRRGREAMARALTDKADQHRAMFRTGLGWVDFVWGDDGTPTGRAGTNLPGRRVLPGKGLAHLIGERIREDGLTQQGAERIAQRMVDVIARGSEVRRATYSGATRAIIEHDGYEAILTKQDGSNTWLVTGFERKGAGGDTAANDAGVPTRRSADSSDRTQVAAPRNPAGMSGEGRVSNRSDRPSAESDDTLPRNSGEDLASEEPADRAGEMGHGASGPDVTGVKNAQTKAEREARGLEELNAEGKRSYGQVWTAAESALRDDPQAGLRLAAEIARKPRALTPEEQMVLAQDRARIFVDRHKAAEAVNAAVKAGDAKAEAIARDRMFHANQQLETSDMAARQSGYEQGLALARCRSLRAGDKCAVRLRGRECARSYVRDACCSSSVNATLSRRYTGNACSGGTPLPAANSGAARRATSQACG